MKENKITCFVPDSDHESLSGTVNSLRKSGLVGNIYILASTQVRENTVSGVTYIEVKGNSSSDAVMKMAERSETRFTLLYLKPFSLDTGTFSLERMAQVCSDAGAGFVYSAFYQRKGEQTAPHPLTDYQPGSLRDDFNFGSVLLFDTAAFKEAATRVAPDHQFAGLYDMRLKISQKNRIVYIPEYLYTEVETDFRKSGEKQFDYVDPRNRAVQIEMEEACTSHLKEIGGWLAPEFTKIEFGEEVFEYEASVIIPVKNRVKTLEDAVKSVLSQEAPFKFNLIVIDNFSTDGTSELLKRYAANDPRVVHLVPRRSDLGIGGCWNEGIFSEKCGKFAIQLDSDDIYINTGVVKRIVDEFYLQNCGMLIGSYRMVNFSLEEIPPGLIDHKEWTPDNGRNNALRINGLGAPRAFYTPLLREIKVPNVSYGEDYAVGLAISRHYQIGRIYDPLYLCRRWDENSDASLDVNKTNAHNLYKDRIRTIELFARMQLVAGKKNKD
jgi:hypothetical protein